MQTYLPAILSAAALVTVSVISNVVTITLALRARHDKRSTVVDERRLMALEELWKIVGGFISQSSEGVEQSLSARDGHGLANSIRSFIASEKGAYISQEIEILLLELCEVSTSGHKMARPLAKIDEVRKHVRAEMK